MSPHSSPLVASPSALIALCLSIILGVAGQLLMKWAALQTVAATPDPKLVFSLIVALAVYSLGVAAWIVALRDISLSVAYPLTSLNYVGIFAGSHYWFGEHISATRAVGVALIFAGVLLVVLFAETPGTRRPSAARPSPQ